jgi:hypothetical protein
MAFARFFLLLTPASLLLPAVFAQKPWTPPRTPDGQPDLQGIWTNITITPLERPAQFAGKPFMTKEQAADFEKRTLANNNADRRDGGAEADVGRAYNDAWYDRGTKTVPTLRTSLFTDPPDGRIPPLTPERQKQMAALAHRRPAHAAQFLQQQLSNRPGAGLCDDPRRDDPRCPHHPSR